MPAPNVGHPQHGVRPFLDPFVMLFRPIDGPVLGGNGDAAAVGLCFGRVGYKIHDRFGDMKMRSENRHQIGCQIRLDVDSGMMFHDPLMLGRLEVGWSQCH